MTVENLRRFEFLRRKRHKSIPFNSGVRNVEERPSTKHNILFEQTVRTEMNTDRASSEGDFSCLRLLAMKLRKGFSLSFLHIIRIKHNNGFEFDAPTTGVDSGDDDDDHDPDGNSSRRS